MTIGPILEKMLLSGDAVFKTASLGFGGLMSLEIPPGKTYIITDITLEPFLNIIEDNGNYAARHTFAHPIATQSLQQILQRNNFQLLLYNARLQHRWTFQNDTEIVSKQVDIDTPLSTKFTEPSVKPTQRKIECFIIVEQTTFFFITFPEMINDFFQAFGSDYATFYQNVNYFPQNPPPGYLEPLAYTIRYVYSPLVGQDQFYIPTGIENFNFPSTLPQSSPTIVYPNVSSSNSTGINPPEGTFGLYPLKGFYMPSLPFINVSYIEINKRQGTRGIFE